MTNEELKEALSQQRREQVDANIGQVSLRPTAQPGGQYAVQVRSTPKENAYTELSKALNQFPQIAGQYANIQKAAAAREIEALSPEELEERAFNGDQGARETIFNRFKSEGINEALFNARYETVIFPKLAAQEQQFKDMRPDEVEELFQDENGNPLKSEDVIENLRLQFTGAIPEDVKTNPNQKVMYNKLLRQLNGVATKSYAVLEQKRQKFLDDSVLSSINRSAKNFNFNLPENTLEDNVEITDDAGVRTVSGISVEGDSLLPSLPKDDTEPLVVRNKISIYSPQKGGKLKKMEGGLKSSIAGADGKSIVRTLEDFRKDPENTVVTVAGNPEFYGRRYVVESMTYQKSDGTKYTLSNVPVMVHDTGDRFKTAPEGRFDIPVERNTDEDAMKANNALLKDISFIRDKGSESGKPVKVKRTATEQTKQRSEDVGFKQESSFRDVFRSMDNTFDEAVAKAKKGSSLTETQLRNSVEKQFQSTFNEMILNDQHVQVQEIIDRAQGKGPEGESIPPMLFKGERLSPTMLTGLQQSVWAQERRLETTEPERTKAEKDALKEAGTRLSSIALTSPDVSLEDTKEAIAANSIAFEQEARAKGYSQDTKKEYYDQVRLLEDNLPRLGAGEKWDGLYLTPDFLNKLESNRDPGSRFREQLMNQSELLRVAQTEGIDLSDLQISSEDYNYLSKTKQIQWDSITNGLTFSAMTRAAPEALEELALLYQNVGESDFEKDILVPDQDEDGKEIEGQQVRAGVLYQKLLRKHMTEKLTELISDTKEQKKLIDEAARIKGRKVEAKKDPLERRVQARKLEEEFGREDFLDREGSATRQYGDRDDDFSANDGDFLDRWVKTAENPEALNLMEAQTDKDTLASALENVTGRVNKVYLQSAANAAAGKLYKPLKIQEIINRLNKQIQYTGVPISVHEEGMQIEGYSGLVDRLYQNKYTIDLNKGDRYSKPETAKTHVYSFYATREAGFKDTKNVRLRKLYNIYFKGQEATYSVEQFITDQTELGKQLKIISSK